MSYERELLQKSVLPQLNDELGLYCDNAYFDDTRLGVHLDLDTEDGAKMLLPLCLDKLDYHKYMVVFLGERYGYIPSDRYLSAVCHMKGMEYQGSISVNELEIIYGALLNRDSDKKILFYFRELDTRGMSDEDRLIYEAESEEHRAKMDSLKQRIISAYPNRVRRYRAKWDSEKRAVVPLDNLSQMLLQDLSGALSVDADSETYSPWQDRCLYDMEKHYELMRQRLCPDVNLFDFTYSPSEDRGIGFIYITSDGISGKSALLTDLYNSFQGEKMIFSFGLHERGNSVFDFASVLIRTIEDLCYEDYSSPCTEEEYLDTLSSLLCQLDIYLDVYVDNADGEFISFMYKLENLLRGIKIKARFIVAVQDNLPYYPFLEDSQKLTLSPLNGAKRLTLAEFLFARSCMTLSSSVTDQITDNDFFGDPSMIAGTVEYIKLSGLEHGEITLPDTQPELVEKIIDCLRVWLGETVDRFLEVISVLPCGVSAYHIQNLFSAQGWDLCPLYISIIAKALSCIIDFSPVCGRYTIKDTEVRKAFIERRTLSPDLVLSYMTNSLELGDCAFLTGIIMGKSVEESYNAQMSMSEWSIKSALYYLAQAEMYTLAIDVLAYMSDYGWDGDLFPSVTDAPPRSKQAVLELLFAIYHSKELKPEIKIRALISGVDYVLERVPSCRFSLPRVIDEARGETDISIQTRNELLYTLLKIISFSRSSNMYEDYLTDNSIINSMSIGENDHSLLLRASQELYGLMYDLNIDGFERYEEVAKREAHAVKGNYKRCTEGELIALIREIPNQSLITFAKSKYPMSLAITREEIRDSLTSVEPCETELNLKRAKALHELTGKDLSLYLKAIISHITAHSTVEAARELLPVFVELVRHSRSIKSFEYIEIINLSSVLYDLEMTREIDKMLKDVYIHSTLPRFINMCARYTYLEEDAEALKCLSMEYFTMRGEFQRTDEWATVFLDDFLRDVPTD